MTRKNLRTLNGARHHFLDREPAAAFLHHRPKPAFIIALLAITFSLALIAPARANVYSYDLNVNSFFSNNNPALFGAGSHSTVVFDNGNSTNQNQTYRYADIVNVATTSTGGTFSMTAAQPKTITYTGTNTDTFATTNALGNLLLSPPFLEVNVNNDATIFTAINGDQVLMSAWWFTGTWQGEKNSTAGAASGGLSPVPEPSTLAMIFVGLASLGLPVFRTSIRRR
jgi:hypothetical protein